MAKKTVKKKKSSAAKTVSVYYRLTGNRRGLLMHNPAGMKQVKKKAATRKTVPPPEVEAEMASYRLPSGQLYLKSEAAWGAVRNAASGMRVETRSAKMTAKRALSGGILFPEEVCPLFDPKTLAPLVDYEINTQRAVVQGNGVMRNRPHLREWACDVLVEIDPEVLNEEVLFEFFERAGQFSGVGDQRPSAPKTPGFFGTFDVEIVSAAEHEKTVKKATAAAKSLASKAKQYKERAATAA